VLDAIFLFRNPLTSCRPSFMEVSSDVPGPAIITDGLNLGAAFFSSEAMSGEDLNGDGDLLDLIVRYFRLYGVVGRTTTTSAASPRRAAGTPSLAGRRQRPPRIPGGDGPAR